MIEVALHPDEEMREGLVWYTKFVAEDRGIPVHKAAAVAHFMHRAALLQAVQRPTIWAPEDSEIVRVYFDLWSQNRMPAVWWMSRIYFDAEYAEVYVTQIGRQSWEKVPLSANWARTVYSGARTRSAIAELVEVTRCLREELASTC